MPLLADVVIIHFRMAESELSKADMPVNLEAVSAYTVCSRVKSTATLENGLFVRLIDIMPPKSISLNPG